ncbi:putative T7SS-secreted protein [Kitasatospora herbaricolor]|uniref:Putative T7SS secretion signal domain-containing protein n=1 Tax=Kitasatospora herbaricolor TaxID=68217 RepID=A0ABZ1WI08_9ACTN|nr:hypothetical protein [Kitasatospora herbaricolor]
MSGPFGGYPWGSPDRDGFEALGFDPAPGSLPGIESMVRDLQRAAKELQDAHTSVLRASNNGQAWQGEAADAFSARIAKLPQQLATAQDSFTSAYRTMDSWHGRLADLQRRADEEERQAKDARDRRNRAAGNPDLKLAGLSFGDDRQLADAEARYKAANAELATADAELSAIVAQAKHMRGDHDRLAQEAAAAIARAASRAPDGPGWFAKLVDGIEGFVAANLELADAALKWVQDHANAIAAIGDLLSNASTAVGLAGLALHCIPTPWTEAAAVALDGVSVGLAGGALAAHSVAALAGADVPPMSFATDIMGTVPVVGSLGKLGKAGAALARAGDEANVVGAAGTSLSVTGWLMDSSGLRVFLPRNDRQGIETATGGSLLVGIENSWHDGYQKDKAATREKAGASR